MQGVFGENLKSLKVYNPVTGTYCSDKLQHLHNHAPGGHSLIWPIRGRAAGQGMVFGLSALNRVSNFIRNYPRQGLNLS